MLATSTPLNARRAAVSWTCQLIAAGTLAQTLFFKFTAAPESVYIFTTLGMEPWGRLASGCAELVAAALLLHRRTAGAGAVLALGVITGAIGSHLTRLGVDVQGDGGLLFALAILVFVAAGIVLALRRRDVLALALRGRALLPRHA